MPQIDCDVLVIGGGIAGCLAALRAKDKAPRVVLVEKGKVARSGKSPVAGAGILCPYPSDDLDAWRKEIVVRGEYLSDQDWVDIILNEQSKRIEDMGKWGVGYERDNKGKLVRVASLGSTVTKVVTVSSQQMMETLRKRMAESGINIIEKIMVTNLLTSDGLYPTDGEITGCYGFDARTGEPCIINAGATVLACGGTGWADLSGDGVAMGYRAGAEVWGMEFSKLMDYMSFHGKYTGIHLITFIRLGMRLFNRLGERFMERFYPEQKENVNRQKMALAIIIENLEGRGPVYADLTHLDKNSLQKLRTLPSTDIRVRAIEKEGIDFGKDRVKLDILSGIMQTEAGGIRHNLYGESSLPGLYIAGEVGGLPAAGAGTIPLKLASCCVEGYRGGENAARFALEMGKKPVNKQQLEFLKQDAFRPLSATRGLAPQAFMDEVCQCIKPARVSVFRNKQDMKAVLLKLKEWKKESNNLRTQDLHELVKAHKAGNFVTCIGLVFQSSLIREETRGMNLRIDYPYRDDTRWMKHIVIRTGAKRPEVGFFPVPLYRYPVKLEKYQKLPASIPWPKYLLEEIRGNKKL